MRFTLESTTQVNTVRAYSPQELRIGQTVVRASCIVTAERLITEWTPVCFEALEEAHLEDIFALEPQIVLLGTGARQRFAPAPIRAAFSARAIGLEMMDLGAACRTFNILVHEDRRVAAALFFA
ncbi:MAG: Mth938-like domain-containing protein [Steroidobacteraceae bacterium]